MATAPGFQISLSHCGNWSVSDALREIIANMHDALCQVTASPLQFAYLKNEANDVNIHAQILDGQNEEVIGHITWKKATGRLEVFNGGLSITPGNLSNIGFSRKRSLSGAIGQFGEGLKSALGPLARQGCVITFYTPRLAMRFTSRVNPEEPDDRLLVAEEAKAEPALFRGYSEWTRVEVVGLNDKKDLGLDNFLFLKTAKVRDNRIPLRDEALLLDGSQKGRIYVQGIFVCHRNDLPFGLALGSTVRMTRDRRMLREPSTELFISAIPARSPEPRLVDLVYKELNREKPVPFYEALSGLLPEAFVDQLFAHGLDATTSFYTRRPRRELNPEQDFLLALQDPDTLRAVNRPLFSIVWPRQEAKLRAYRTQITTELAAATVSALSPSETQKWKDVQDFLKCLLPDAGVTVSIVDSTTVYSARAQQVAILDRLPCLWIQQTTTLLLDQKLLNNRNVHNRIKAEMEHEHATDKLKWQRTECENRHCACLQATILTHVQEQHGLSLSYCTKVLANYSKKHQAAIVCALNERMELVDDSSPSNPWESDSDSDASNRDDTDARPIMSNPPAPSSPPDNTAAPGQAGVEPDASSQLPDVKVQAPVLAASLNVEELDDGQLRDLILQGQTECFRRWSQVQRRFTEHSDQSKLATEALQKQLDEQAERGRALRATNAQIDNRRVEAEALIAQYEQEDAEHTRQLEEHLQKRKKRRCLEQM
ncbi:hypothetical protein HKX48_004881 [Thoreauomyces humboldtii]|nr:hypothetical protein HKX48_004881 [Thoreauomyces humboldtii]